MLISRLVAVSLALGLWPGGQGASACTVRDFLTTPLPASSRPAISLALETAFPGVIVDDAARTVSVGGARLPLGTAQPDPKRRLTNASIADQFVQSYPLDFDLRARQQRWFDPGRARNDAFFRALYGQTEGQVARSLARASYKGTRFAMTTRYCVASQLQAALNAIAAEGPAMDPIFRNVGGSFNWRVIAGTQRLSAHSFGIAVDFNTSMGGYWRWAGEPEGNVGPYNNVYPEALVRHMERFGFIWGGKWHHYDGMHFEYRPELILHARLTGAS